MPEPVTTVVGLGLLSVAQCVGTQRPNNFRRLANGLSDHFDYKIEMKSASTITVQFIPRRSGQLPRSYPRINKLYDTPEAIKALQQRSQLQLKRGAILSALEPAGLLKPPLVRSYAKLPAVKHRYWNL